MNKVCLVGRITKDIELRANDKDISYTRFTLAVNRKHKNANGEYEADFISCVAWRERAELLSKHFGKGSQIGIEGHIQTGSYDKEDGSKVYLTDVIVDSISFIGTKKNEEQPAPSYEEDDVTGFEDSDLPF